MKEPAENMWNHEVDFQKKICDKYKSDWQPINMNLKIGISKDLGKQPLNGLRHMPDNGTSGWFIWSGEFKDKVDFFQPMHAKHLLEIKPEIIKYLALEPGYRFLFDDKGYEDVWFDENLKQDIGGTMNYLK